MTPINYNKEMSLLYFGMAIIIHIDFNNNNNKRLIDDRYWRVYANAR